MADDRPRGLGRGLSALIGEEAVPTRGEAQARPARTVPIAFLKPNRFQPRKRFAEDDLNDLVQSIKAKGILQPILVRPIAGQANAYEIVAGERRWRAAQLAKLHDVPVVVREMNDGEALELAIIENVQRADLNAIEEAAAYQELMDRFGYTQEKVASEVGKSRSHVANTLRLIKLPETVKTMVRDGQLTAGHARTLIGVTGPEARAREILAGALNVREAEQRSQAKKRKIHKQPVEDPNIRALEDNISNALGLKVQILHKEDKGGEVRISYKTLEQLDELTRRLKNRG
ncbi:MAG: ParB/RepB/Spo0J family partition protein [Alphaproteobacteria bacterium]|nr:ParB/RepB/Spo0J family partition protein [Alphaproteobacteria bacterium]MDE2492353.1 ParB/RepB/Spo0J family partition protein [Alphaproteobacteria bacterium]